MEHDNVRKKNIYAPNTGTPKYIQQIVTDIKGDIDRNTLIAGDCSYMDGTRDSHTEWSKSERERQIPYDITYIWNLIYGTNEPFHRKETHGLGELTCGCQGGGIGMDWELGVNRCKLLPLEWISNEILLCSTGNYVWSLMKDIIMWEKRMYTCMCNWVTMLYNRKLTEHCKPAIMKIK